MGGGGVDCLGHCVFPFSSVGRVLFFCFTCLSYLFIYVLFQGCKARVFFFFFFFFFLGGGGGGCIIMVDINDRDEGRCFCSLSLYVCVCLNSL